jgi:hypothetical protein
MVKIGEDRYRRALNTISIETTTYDRKYQNDLRDRFCYQALLNLAGNVERAGRPLDAAEIYEKQLRMYDKARELRARRAFLRTALS